MLVCSVLYFIKAFPSPLVMRAQMSISSQNNHFLSYVQIVATAIILPHIIDKKVEVENKGRKEVVTFFCK